MDISKKSYRTAARFFRDNPTVSEIRWVDALPDAPALPFMSGIVSGECEPDKWLSYPLGEVAGSPRRFVGKRAPVGIDGTHYCGTPEDFALGGVYDAALPPVRYGADGFPLCCGGLPKLLGGAAAGGRSAFAVRNQNLLGGAAAGGRSVFRSYPYTDPTAGGVAVGGSIGDQLVYTDPTAGGVAVGGSVGDDWFGADATRGGVAIGGEVGDRFGFIDGTAGGVAVGGSIGDQLVYTDPTAGGVAVGGRVGDDWFGADAARGGVAVGGSIGDQLVYTDPTAGGVEVGGEVGDRFGFIDGTAGGVEVGGSIGDQLVYTDPTAGGVEVGGEVGDEYTPADGAEGGVEVGGEVGDEYTPAENDPGTTCATAGALTLGVQRTWAPASGGGLWWKCGPLAAGTYYARETTYMGETITAVQRGSCSGLTLLGFIDDNQCGSWTVDEGDTLYMTVSTLGPTIYGVEVGAGTCP